jgi:uncharacterized protein YdeI (YjbR/CyaY-like superfamily)
MKILIWNGEQEEIQASIGGRSIAFKKGEHVEVPDDWAEKLLTNPAFSEPTLLAVAFEQGAQERKKQK